ARDSAEPISPALRSPPGMDAHRGIPRAVRAIEKPVPEPAVAFGHEQPYGPPERAGDVGRHVARRDHQVAGRDERRQSLEVVEKVEIREVLHAGATLALDPGALGCGVAVLEVDEAHPRNLEQRTPVPQRAALVGAELPVRAAPGNADEAGLTGEIFEQAPP